MARHLFFELRSRASADVPAAARRLAARRLRRAKGLGLVALLACLGCRPGSTLSTAPRARDSASPDASTTASIEARPPADAGAAADGAEAIAWDNYIDLKERPGDVLDAYQATYAAMPATPLASLEDAVVLCRLAIARSAPLPTSKWDRVNGRDLLLEIMADDSAISRTEGPLGHASFHVRADDAMRLAASGKRVRWTVRDRDQDHAYPYRTGVVVATFDLPHDVGATLHVTQGDLDIECRGAPTSEAARLLLPAADRALAEAETKVSWGPGDPRGTFQLRDDLSAASDRIRVGKVIAESAKRTAAWTEREERLRAIVRGYLASARDAFDKLAPTPVGTWADVGPTVSARTKEIVCPAIPKGADPGSLNDDQRTGCGLVLELRSPTKLRFDPNPWGPAYACRMTGPIKIESLEGPGSAAGVCTLGIRRAGRWLPRSVELSPTEPTAIVLGGMAFGRAIRITVGDASALLEPPAAP